MLQLRGAYTALVTPFDASGKVDDAALEKLVDAQVQAGIAGLVPCGTTGESPTLDDDEHLGVIAKVVKRVKALGASTTVIGGTGSNSTREAINLSKRAAELGADAVMIVMPYYNKPTQAGLVEHCKQVAQALGKTPVVLYNVPGRTACDLLPDGVEAVCRAAPNVVAIKEATGNVLRAQELVRLLGDRISVLCGDDALTVAMMAVGARGVVSVTSNLLPREVGHVTATVLEGDWKRALALHLALVPVHEAMFVESNPSPVKAALAARGRMKNVVRLPLVPLSEAGQKKLFATLGALA